MRRAIVTGATTGLGADMAAAFAVELIPSTNSNDTALLASTILNAQA
jgi:NAD(P)-dependent dehydrogenase (short-subunit alcohol dehydrogenase family)